MNTTKITTGLTALLLGGSLAAHAEMEIAPGLTASGFIDMSYYGSDADDSDDGASFDQFEIDFVFDQGDGVKAFVDIDYQPNSDPDFEVEQAFLTYDLSSGTTLKAGRFLTPHGYEAAEPTGLWQYSVSATIIGYAGYANGIAASHPIGDIATLYVAAVDGSYTGDENAEDLSFEAQIKLMPAEGLTIQAAYASEEFPSTAAVGAVGDVDFTPATESYDQGIANFWIEYATGGLTLAAEYNQLFEIGGPEGDGDGYLVMANYSWDKFGLTFRHSGVELDDGYENTEFTISPNYTFTDSLFGLIEVRTDDFGDAGEDVVSYAAELIYTF